jgi:hypothetical protein
MILNIERPDANQGEAFDIGAIVKVGPEASEVRFDANQPIDDQLTRSTDPEEAAIDDGRKAWDRLRNHSTFEDWKAVGKACVIGQSTAMRDAHVNKAKGRSYNAAIAAWSKKHGFADLDKGVRSRLLDVMSNLAGIEAELAKLPLNERLKKNHPNTVWRFWQTATKPKDSEPKPKRILIPQAEHMALIAELDRLAHEVSRGGGDLWRPEDLACDIAAVMLGALSLTKAEQVARDMLAGVKARKQGARA